MGRSDGSAQSSAFDEAAANTVWFYPRLAASAAFKTLFREGMSLVEDTAAYLDGPGREESRSLPRSAALAYATESMRLTTRLMQVASWLLLQRAVNEGELTPAEAQSEKHRVRLSEQNVACPSETFEQLPEMLRAFSAKSLRLQARVAHLDRALAEADADAVPPAPRGAVAEQFERLQAAFAR
jgi:regulator of CtrA degradation